MDTEYKIRRNPQGTYDIFRDDSPLFSHSVPDSALQKQLGPYGIANDTYEDVRRQLAEADEANVSIPRPGKFLQV